MKPPYKDEQGVMPGVTTITGELGWNKQVLVGWANRMGLKGVDTNKYVDDKADIGTLAHSMVIGDIRSTDTDTDDYTKNQIKSAENSLLSYLAWEKGKKIEPIMTERPLIHKTLRYGGTPDFYGKVDGVLTLADFKTGKGIYDEFLIQVAGGYLILLENMGLKVDKICILNIPRSGDESFEIKAIPQEKWDVCKHIFTNCLNNYKLKKLL